jgi:L,D-transpeptidase YnhG
MRMNAPDIKALFEQARVGTRVQIINEPVKFSVEPDGKRYIEVHRPLAQKKGKTHRSRQLPTPPTLRLCFSVGSDKALIDKALSRRAGIPVVVSAGNGPSASNACCRCRTAGCPRRCRRRG